MNVFWSCELLTDPEHSMVTSSLKGTGWPMLVALTNARSCSAESGAKSASIRALAERDRGLSPPENGAATASRYAAIRRFSELAASSQEWGVMHQLFDQRDRIENIEAPVETDASRAVASLTAHGINDGESRAGLERTWQQF